MAKYTSGRQKNLKVGISSYSENLTSLEVIGGATFTGESSSELVRISQIGTGPALVVEDSANPDVTPFVVTTEGKVAIGVAAGGISTSYKLEVDGGDIRFVTGGEGDLIISHQDLVSSVRSAGNVQLGLGANGGDAIRVNLDNNVGFGTTNPTSKLYVVGDGYFTGIVTSDKFIGDGSDLINLPESHLVTYASESDISNSATNISGISGYSQVGILTGVDLSTDAIFGQSLAISADGKTLVVGSNNNGYGEVLVYNRSGNSFEEPIFLPTYGDYGFGYSVATNSNGTTIVVGSPYNITETGGGAAYVYNRLNDGYIQVGILTGTYSSDSNDLFGASVSISSDGKTIAVGAIQDELPGNNNTGLVYIYDKIGSTFTQVGIVTVTTFTSLNDYFFPIKFSSDGKTLSVLSANINDSTVKVFDRIGDVFSQVGIITVSNLTNTIGLRMDMSSDGKLIYVGAPGWNTNTGRVIVYQRVGNNYNLLGTFTGSSSGTNDNFGHSVATSADGNVIVVGAINDEITGSSGYGLGYVFNRQGSSFIQVGILTGTYALDQDDYYGYSVSISADGKTIAVGAYSDELPGNNNTGLVYVYDQNRETYLYSGSTGNIGIGTSNPTSKLHIVGNTLNSGNLTVNGTTLSTQLRVTGVTTLGRVQTGDIVSTGVITATSFVGSGSSLTGLIPNTIANIDNNQIYFPLLSPVTSGIISSISVSSNSIVFNPGTDSLGIGTTNPTSKLYVAGDGYFTGVVTATTFNGNVTRASYADVSGISTSSGYANSSGIATYSNTSGFSTFSGYANSAGIATYAGTSGIATYATNAGIATYALTAGIATYATSAGIATYATNAGIATIATKLQTPRIFEIIGDIVASPITFDGTGNVSLAATIQPNSVALGNDTTGDYVQSVSGTVGQITVTGGTGEGSTPVLSFSPNPTIGGNVTIGNDLQVNNNLNVTGNITVGGTTAYIIVQDFRVTDADITLGFTTDAYGNDASTDTTANHGGIAIASTEGNPLVQLVNVAIGESLPATYKKFMWFKAGSFSGLNTDAWLSNYAIGIGSTQFPSGTRLAAGSVQFSEYDLAVVRNINASGIITGTLANSLILNTSGVGLSGIATYNNSGSTTFTVTSNATSNNTPSTIVSRDASGNFSAGTITANLTGTASTASFATTAFNLSDAANITTGTINIARLSGTYNIDISGNAATSTYATNAGIATYATNAGIATYATSAGIATYATNAGIATYATNAGIATYATSAGIATYATSAGIATYATSAGIATYATSAGVSTNVIGGIASVTQLSVSGITTLGVTTTTNLTAQQLNVSGITTVGSLNVGDTQVISSARQLQNIASLDAVTTATIEAAIQNSPNTFTDLQVIGISTLGVTSTTQLTAQSLNVSGLSTFSGITTHTELLFGTQASFTGVVTALSFSGNASSATYATNAGIATYATSAGIATYATSAGIATYATSSGIATYASTAGIATYATNAGIATNLKGGLAGNIPYQSAPDTTTFLANGASGTILQSNGVGNPPTWVPAAPASAISGLTIRDEGNIVGTANSISQLNFVGATVTATASGSISTITVSTSQGMEIRDEGTVVGSAVTSINVVGAGISATASGTATTITSLSPTGGGTDGVFYLNDNTVNTSYTIPLNKNALSAGPITIAVGATVTINAGSNWLVVV